MRRGIWTTTLVVVVIAAVPLASVAGGKGGSGRQGGQGAQASATEHRRGDPRARQSGSRAEQRATTRASDAQREQFRMSTRASEQLRQQVRSTARAAKGSGFGPEQATAQRDRLREQIGAVHQEHQRLTRGLDAGQQQAVRDRLQTLERTLERVAARHRELDGTLGEAAPDRVRVAKQARELERAVKEWQKQYGRLGADLGTDA